MILYRLLRSDEDPSQDLHAKEPLSPTSVEKHVITVRMVSPPDTFLAVNLWKQLKSLLQCLKQVQNDWSKLKPEPDGVLFTQ